MVKIGLVLGAFLSCLYGDIARSDTCNFTTGLAPAGTLMWGVYPVLNTTSCCYLCNAKSDGKCVASSLHGKSCYLFSDTNASNPLVAPDVTGCWARTQAPTLPNVSIEVDWTRPLLGVSGRSRLYGLNLYAGSTSVAEKNNIYQMGMTAMHPGSTRIMRMDKGGHGSWGINLSDSTYGWNRTEISAVLQKLKASSWFNASTAVISTENWPLYLANSSGHLPPGNRHLFSNWAAELVHIVNVENKAGVRYFEVFNEIDSLYNNSFDEAAIIYSEAADSMRSIDSSIKIGGPAYSRPDISRNVLDFVNGTHQRLDFISHHSYSTGSTGSSTASIYDSAASIGNLTSSVYAIINSITNKFIEIWHDEYNISWDPPDSRMTDTTSAVFDALAMRSFILANTTAAQAWNDCDGWYGKLDSGKYGNYSRRPSSFLFEVFNSYMVGQVFQSNSSDLRRIVTLSVMGIVQPSQANDYTNDSKIPVSRKVIAIINRAGSNQTVTIKNNGGFSPLKQTILRITISESGIKTGIVSFSDLSSGLELEPGIVFLSTH